MMNQENSYQHNRNNNNEEFNFPLSSTNVINVSWPERMISTTVGALLFTNGVGNLFRHPLSGLLKSALGGYLMYRGASGNCALYSLLGNNENKVHSGSVNIRTTMVVNKPKEEVYRFWRNLENLPLFMNHIKSVKEDDEKRSHWVAEMPGKLGRVRWVADIVEDEENRKIAWQSTPESMIENAGKVVFEEALGGQGTKLDIVISYRPPAADLGRGIANMLNPMVEKYVRDDIANFKSHIETETPLSANAGTSVHHEPASNSSGEPTERVYR